MPLSIDLAGRVAVVTGTTSGLGTGIATAMAEAGCRVIGCGSRPAESEGALAFIESVESYSQETSYIRCDVTDPADIEQFGDSVAQLTNRVDVLVSNAGLNVLKNPEECKLEDWEYNCNLNLRSHWLLSQAMLSLLKNAERPVIELMSSVHGYRTLPNCFPYNIAKAGIIGMVRSLALDWAPKIRTVGIAPGFIETALTVEFLKDPETRKRIEQARPVGRLGTTADVGALCAFLASDLADFISGETIVIDGGKLASLG